MVGLGGLEPPASSLSGTRSNQLSYKPTRVEPPDTNHVNKLESAEFTVQGRAPLGIGIDGPSNRQAEKLEHVPINRTASIDYWPTNHRVSCAQGWYSAPHAAHELPLYGLRRCYSLERR
jgi:hypothetical protein